MQTTTASDYQKENLAVRYGIMAQAGDPKVKVEGYKKIIEICKSLGWQ